MPDKNSKSKKKAKKGNEKSKHIDSISTVDNETIDKRSKK